MAYNTEKGSSKNPHNIGEDPVLPYADNMSEDDEMYLDNVMDLLEVECSEIEMFGENRTNHMNKIYEIEDQCVVCHKTFSSQRDFAKHAQQDHPNEKVFRCKYCHVIFSKLKSVTAHFNRTHAELDSSSHSRNNISETNEEDFFSNRRGKIYPVETKCAICNKQFSSQRDLVKHTQQFHPNDKVFKCLYCPTVFSKLKSVTTHYNRSHSKIQKTIACEFCNKKFFTRFLLERHRRAHTEQRPFACNLCDKSYKYKRNLLVHMKTHSKKHGKNQCTADEYCENEEQNLVTEDEYYVDDEDNSLTADKYFDMNDQNLSTENEEEGINISTFASDKRNFNSVVTQYPFKCNECGRAFQYENSLILHKKTHQKNNEPAEIITLDDSSDNEQQDSGNIYNGTYFIIDELNTDPEHCENVGGEDELTGGIYSDEYNYADFAPANIQNSPDINQNECGICLKAFQCQQSVAKHLLRCHAEIEFFKCPYCDDNFYSLDALSLHITIKKHPQKRNVCEVCLKSFDRNSDLKRHALSHSNGRPYVCDMCNKNFKQVNHLKRHKESSHDLEMPLRFNCNICPRKFFLEDALKRHMAVHNREINYPCGMCNKGFRSRYDWQRHQETHSSRKYLICEYCLKSFGNSQTLDLHLKEHTGERKFLCTTCNKTFTHKSHLVTHRRSHTKL